MKVNQEYSSKIKKSYLSFLKKQEVFGEPFYDKIGQLEKFYLPICNLIHQKYKYNKKKTLVVGLSGGQGSGKTTITQILRLILNKKYNLNISSFSIDDFYKTYSERLAFSKKIHNLFITRGVPGTHDVKFIKKTFRSLLVNKFKSFCIPKFDKSADDRHPKKNWVKIKKKPDIIIFEGWCVGAKHQKIKNLEKTVNLLEKNKDSEMIWRKKVNNELKNSYKSIFKLIDILIFLAVPSFQYVYKWRLLQEKKLKINSKVKKKTMTQNQIKKFVMYYERITKQMLKDQKTIADIIIKLDKKHRLSGIRFN